jgi:hypothetical protein
MLATIRRRIFCLPVCYPKEGPCTMQLDTMEILCVFKNNAITHVGTAARFVDLYAEKLARSRFTTGMACDRPFRSRFSIFFLDPVANVELLRRLCFALHAYHVALPTSTSEFRPKCNLPNVIKTYLLSFNCKIQPRCSNFIT